MKYVIVTTDWLISKGVLIQDSWRKSIDETKIILHYDIIEPLFINGEYIEMYEYDSLELRRILNSEEWSLPYIG